MKLYHAVGVSLALLMASASTLAQAQVKNEYLEFEAREQSFDALAGPLGAAGPVSLGGVSNGAAGVVMSFQGISQYDVASFGRNFIPPDTMGAVGKTQFMEFVNGGVAVFDKATGTRTSIQSDVAFWAGAGQVGTNGDQRVMYNAAADRWIALSFGSSVADIQIAVSNTSDALGPWQSTKFTGFAGGTADYPTLALDSNAVYIGTNDFNAAGNFRGTTLNVIPLSDLFNATGPTVAGLKTFSNPYDPASSTNDFSRGFAIQGVNSNEVTTTGNIVTVSLTDFGLQRYDVLNAGTAGAVLTGSSGLLGSDYAGNDLGRQPYTTGVGDPRVIDTLDDRISASAWEVNGRIYTLHTITEIGSDYTSVRYDIFDSVTNALLDEGDIGMAGYDFYQGSLAVNEFGQVVIAYNRSGTDPSDGRIGFFARTFTTDPTGHLVQQGTEILLKTSDTDSYHNGSIDGQAAVGRQRWGDYSAVTVDPTDSSKFWVIGEFAREFNDPANGHPGGTGGSRWGTFISEIGFNTSVPEPSTWAMLLLGMGFAGATLRRRRTMITA